MNKTAKIMAEFQEIVIIGAGIAGLATALALKRIGIQSLVLERSCKLRTTGAGIFLYPNAWQALTVLEVAHNLTSVYDAYDIGNVTNLDTGKKSEVSFTHARSGMGVRAIHRRSLLEVLAEELPSDTIRFSAKLASIRNEPSKDLPTHTILLLEDGTTIKTKVLIGCDGVQSRVAQWLGLSAPVNSGRSCIRGLSVYPEGHGLRMGTEQFISDGKRAGFIPLNDHDVFWFITNPTTQREKELAKEFKTSPLLIQNEVIEHLAKDYPQSYHDVVQRSDNSYLSWAPLMFRAPWDMIVGPVYKGAVTVAGDAMHPMTPDLGQGGCSALEDAVVLARNIGPGFGPGGKVADMKKVEDGICSYARERRWRVAGLIAGSYLSGWVQQGGSGVWASGIRLFRDYVFYRFFYSAISKLVEFDCGPLSPTTL